MGRVWVFVLVLLVPQFAAARMYMCVDEATGATSFTDKACDTETTVGEEIKVNPTNYGSGKGRQGHVRVKSWRSQTDVRKTGNEFNTQRRSLYESKATAGTQ
jgi:hypothetical protein